MYPFEYHRPASVADAAGLLMSHPDAKLLAGGMTLIPTMKQRLAQPSDLVDLAGIQELKGIKLAGNAVTIGAMTPHAEVADSADVQRAIPALAYLAGIIGDVQVRNRGTIGGSIANSDPSADYPGAVVGLGATIKTNKREIKGDDFFQDLFTTALEDGEIIVSVTFPVPEKAAYQKFPNPASRYAMVGVFISRGPMGVRVGVTGAGPSAFRVTAMEEALTKSFTINAINGLTVPADGLNEDLHATRAYRAHLIGVMAKRALAQIV
jgi:carbon-monoxide dehydrogenase medium subunit